MNAAHDGRNSKFLRNKTAELGHSVESETQNDCASMRISL